MLGAILLTGYLGGAVASDVRIGNPLFTYMHFPVYPGIMIGLGLIFGMLDRGRLYRSGVNKIVHDAAVRSGTSYQLLLEREFEAPRELVFEVWSEPKHLANWWGPNGFSMPFCEVDFRVDGKYRICMRSPEGEDHWLTGEYKVIDRPQRIVFTWLRENPDGSIWCDTLVEASFEGAADRTRFRMHQTGFGSSAHRDEHRGGWSECLNRLAEYVATPTGNL